MTNSARLCIQSAASSAPRFRYRPRVQIGSMIQVSGMIVLDPDGGQLASGGADALPLGACVEIEFSFVRS